MAGAKHTNRHLQRLMLRGLMLPAAAAGAIVLGASAASADEGNGPVPLESAASDVQSPVDAAGTTVTSTGPPTPSPARQPSSGPGSGGSHAQLAETDASLVERGPAGAVQHSAPDAADPQGAAGVAEKASVTEGHEARRASARDSAAPNEPPPVEPLSAPALPTEALPAEALPTEPLPTQALPSRETPADGLPTEQLATGATATVDEVTRQVARPLDQAAPLLDQAAPASDRLAAPIDEATPVYDRLLDELAMAPVPEVDATRALEAELLEPVGELDQVVEPSLAPVTDTVGGLAERALAPAVATTPIFTGVAEGLLTDLGEVPTGTTGPVLASVTKTTPLFDELTGELLTPLTSVLADAVTPQRSILLPALDPASGEGASTAPAVPAWQPSPSSPTATGLSAATTSGWAADWTPAYDVPDSTTAAHASDAGQPSTAVPPLVGSLLAGEEPHLSGASVLAGRDLDRSAWSAPVASQPVVARASGAGDVDPLPGPDRNLLTQAGGLVDAITAPGGAQQGASGSVLLLLLAVFGAALLVRAGGLAQLTPGTATALSGRAAQVQDRPG